MDGAGLIWILTARKVSPNMAMAAWLESPGRDATPSTSSSPPVLRLGLGLGLGLGFGFGFGFGLGLGLELGLGLGLGFCLRRERRSHRRGHGAVLVHHPLLPLRIDRSRDPVDRGMRCIGVIGGGLSTEGIRALS